MRYAVAAIFTCGLVVPAWAAGPAEMLARARHLYNQGLYDAALEAAAAARRQPQLADTADLVAARIYLERFRQTAAISDLDDARLRLRAVTPAALAPRDRLELIVGLAESLYLEGAFGASVALFDSVAARSGEIGPATRDRLLDWWANGLDREAQTRPAGDRAAFYRQIHTRMQDELQRDSGSTVAVYWLAAAARGMGDAQAAWDAVMAGWVRAPFATDRGVALRADLDRLMTTALIAERARATGLAVELVKGEWERFRERWTK